MTRPDGPSSTTPASSGTIADTVSGLLLKAEMVLWLAEVEPQVETVDTWNAESNTYMIAVNERLGYRVLGREMQYQRRLP